MIARLDLGHQPFEEAMRMLEGERAEFPAIRGDDQDFLGIGHESADRQPRIGLMRAEHAEGVSVAGTQDCLQIGGTHPPIPHTPDAAAFPL